MHRDGRIYFNFLPKEKLLEAGALPPQIEYIFKEIIYADFKF